MLPKIHKEGNPGRPVVSSISCPTYNISKYLSTILRPIVEKCDTFVKDTSHLLQKLNSVTFEDNTNINLFTLDVSGLYTNIPNNEGLTALKYFLEKEDNLPAPVSVLLRLSELVLKENCFEFNGEFFKQISGTIMGSPFSVNYSCLAMSYEEKRIADNYQGVKPLMYVRYIDDIFGISNTDLVTLNNYIDFIKNFNPALKYTGEIGKEVNMLDTTLNVGTHKIESTLYTKPTDSHAYLRYNSSHPRSCKDNIPYSQLLRIKKICSNINDYNIKCREMINYFRAQGYPKNILDRAKTRADSVSRESLLVQNVRTKEKEDRIVFPITYHPRNLEVINTIKNNYSKLANDDEVGDLFTSQPLIAYRRDTNIKDLLVHARVKDTGDKGTKPCGRSRCFTCRHVSKEDMVVGPRGSFSPRSSFTCETKGLVYCIICKKCGELYVGESGRRLGDRFREHLKDVRDKADKEVARHFNSDRHRGVEDMEVCGLLLERGLISRKLKEQKMIGRLGCFLGRGMNTDYNSVFVTPDM